VEIARVAPSPEAPGRVDVTVTVADQAGTTVRDGKPVTLHSGAFDLRLSRDGQLAGWRDGALPLDGQGRATVTFTGIRLPQGEGGEAVEFSAYAFNADRVKSATARQGYVPPAATAAAPPRRAYLVNIGVNAYANPAWDLRFAANDARRLQQALAGRLAQGGEFAEVVPVTLVSEARRQGRQRVVTSELATRSNVQAVLDLLAGREVPAETVAAIPGAQRLRPATPDDLVLISFSGHGYAGERGVFHLLTADAATGQGRQVTEEMLLRSVSSEELSKWLREVDAGELELIIDACHSAASVEGEGFKPGPMGSRGLGQLAYDKGMKVLAASQSAEVALEAAELEQGLLTYALVRDGLEAGQADFRPRDETVRMGEWLAYAVERVPALHDELQRGEVQSFGREAAARAVPGLDPQLFEGRRELQQPSLFDFRRRGREAALAR
jgi:hypothetical protein